MSTSESTAAACYRHPNRSTRLACSDCGRPICLECSNDAAVGQKCPECASHHGRGRVVQARTLSRTSGAPVSITLIGISVGIFILTRLGLIDVFERFAQWNVAVEAGEWWRVLTASFLHANLGHLLFNMWALYLFGPPLERQVGPAAFTSLYFSAAAAGGAFAYVLGDPRDVVVGASGAIFGLFGAWLVASYRSRRTPAGASQFRMLLVLLLINAALPLVIPNISWQGHLGGFAAGALTAALWARPAIGSSAAARTGSALGVGLVALALVVLL